MDVKKLLSMSEDMWTAIQDWRFKHRCETSSDAMRKLIEIGLESKPVHYRENENEQKKSPNGNPTSHKYAYLD